MLVSEQKDLEYTTCDRVSTFTMAMLNQISLVGQDAGLNLNLR